MRKKGELAAILLAVVFIALSAVYALAPSAGGVFTEREASAEQLMSGADNMPVSELMPGETVDLNSADAERLCLLPGIGEAAAEGIIAYREENGAFSCIEDIKKVSGIGEKKFEQIKDLITAGKEH